MVDKALIHTTRLIIIYSTCYSMWQKLLSSLMSWETDDSNLNWPGEPNTRTGNYATYTTFLLSFRCMDPGHSPRLQSLTTLHPYIAIKINPTSTKRVNDRSTTRSNQVLKLTDYHISRHVASTFKSLTKYATHRDLNIFATTQTGNHMYHIPACGPYIIAECKSISTPIISRVVGNYSTFTAPISQALVEVN